MPSTPQRAASLPSHSHRATVSAIAQFDHERSELKRDIEPKLVDELRTDIDREIHRDRFCPPGTIENLFAVESVRKRVERLYGCSVTVHQGIGPSLQQFCSIIWHSDAAISASTALAILICLDTEVTSREWQVFLREVRSGALCNAELPLSPRSSLLAELHGSFNQRQYGFCPIVLERAEYGVQEISGYHAERPLPYLSEESIGEGGAGTVYKVKIARGAYLWPRDDAKGELADFWARKDMELVDARDELKLASQLLRDDIKHKHLVETLGSLLYSKRVPSSDSSRGRGSSRNQQVSLFFEPAHADLHTFMRTIPRERYPLRTIIQNLAGIAGALSYLHNGIVVDGVRHYCYHLDIKPENVLVFLSDRLVFKLADFSISQVKPGKDDPMTALNHYTATFRGNDACLCVAPEATLEHPRLSSKCDVWSFACTMCMLLAWTHGGKDEVGALKRKLRTQQPNSIRDETYQFFATYSSPKKPKAHGHYWIETKKLAFEVNHWAKIWLKDLGPHHSDDAMDTKLRKILCDKLLIADPALRAETAVIHQQLLDVLDPPVGAQDAQTGRFSLRAMLPRRRPAETARHLQVSPEVLKCASSPQSTHLVFMHKRVVEVFDISPTARHNTAPVTSISVDSFRFGANAYWRDCCLNNKYLFLVPGVESGASSRSFKLIIYRLEALQKDTADHHRAQCARIEVAWTWRIDRIAAAPLDEVLLSCTVLKPDSSNQDWEVMLLKLPNLRSWFTSQVSRTTSTGTLDSHAPSQAAAIAFGLHESACDEVRRILPLSDFLSVPITGTRHIFMRPCELRFSPNGECLILVTEQTSTKDIHTWWWQLRLDGDAEYHGHQHFGSEGARDISQPAYTAATVTRRSTVFLVLHNQHVYMRTPTADLARHATQSFIEDFCEISGKIRDVLVPGADLATKVLFVGESQESSRHVGIFSRTLAEDMKFERQAQVQEIATSSHIKFSNLLNQPALHILCPAVNWYESQREPDAWVLVLVTYAGLIEVLDISLHP